VEDEEKKSLPKSEQRSLQKGIAGFGLHCFPDITVDEPSNFQRCSPTEENFRRLTYENIGSNDSDTTSQADGGGTCRLRKDSISTAQLNEQAYQRGLADGWEKGMIEGENTWHAQTEKKIKPLLTSLQDVLHQLNNLRKETYQDIEKEVVELALAIARQVICQEITIDKEIVVCVAREALAKVEDPGRIKIKMSPSDMQFIKETRSQLSNMIENIDHVTFEGAENIQSGGCIIETDLGEIDARIEKQLQAVEESFRTVVEKT
jgi:flagellar assembly protein FliH